MENLKAVENQTSKVPQSTYIIIVNWNGKQILEKCLSSLYKNTLNSEFRVLVVDNASSDGSVGMVQKQFPHVEIIKNRINSGFAKGNNQGIRHALKKGAKNIILLNNDIEIIDTTWLESFLYVLKLDSKIGIVGCKLLYPNRKIQHAGGIISLRVPHHRGEGEKDHGQYDRVETVDYVTGAALMIKREVITKIGLLDEGFSPVYFEDTDWCVRAKLSGYQIVYTPKPTLIHHCGASSGKLGSELKRFYARKNHIRFTILNYPILAIARWLILFESRVLIRCIIGRPKQGKLPLAIRFDASSRLRFFVKVWMVNLEDLKSILALRRQRFSYGIRLSP